jgi:hypothetical protein
MNTQTRYFYTLSFFEKNNVFSVVANTREEADKFANRLCEVWEIGELPIYHSQEVV